MCNLDLHVPASQCCQQTCQVLSFWRLQGAAGYRTLLHDCAQWSCVCMLDTQTLSTFHEAVSLWIL